MEVLLNDNVLTVNDETSLLELVFSQVGEKQNGIAIAINNSVIPKATWENHYLQANDQILLIKATQGG